MHLFGLAHAAWLIGIAAAAVVLSMLSVRKPATAPAVRIALGTVLAAGELIRYYTDGFPFPYGLPFNLCNVATWVAVLACITMSPLAIEFVYFAGIAGAGMALITPDMGSVWPVRFFVNHGALVIAAIVLMRISPLRRGAIWRAYGLLAVYCVLVGIFDWKSKANFAYLRSKPKVSALSLMGPWPFYILWAGAAALFIFWLLWLPIRNRQRRVVAEPALAPEIGV